MARHKAESFYKYVEFQVFLEENDIEIVDVHYFIDYPHGIEIFLIYKEVSNGDK